MKIEKGKRYKTRGGWEAEVIWVLANNGYGYAMHFRSPEVRGDSLYLSDNVEDGPYYHSDKGKALTLFSIHEPPSYHGHPADIVEELTKNRLRDSHVNPK